jgi:spore germination protein YaaH
VSVKRRLWPNNVVRAAVSYTAFGLLIQAVALSIQVSAAEDTYTVKRGDTVFSIARHFSVQSSDLAERNGIGRNFHIYPGQRLFIPSKAKSASSSTARKTVRLVLPQSVQKAIDKAPVKAGRWKYIVIHHSGVDTGTVQGMDKYHREVRHMENGLAYHFVIGNGSGMGNGEITVCRRWTRQLAGGHLASEAQNNVALGICLVGNFDKHTPTAKEMASLKILVEALMARCHIPPQAVKTHQQINVVHTRCPGAKFPTKAFMDSLRAPGK